MKSDSELMKICFPDGTINELPIPAALMRAICEGRWKTPSIEKLKAIFHPDEIVHPSFYGPASLDSENFGWKYNCKHDETDKYFLGGKDTAALPGDIDPKESILIADLGWDRPIALDYRETTENPRVVYLAGDVNSAWIDVAPDIETFMTLLGLTSSPP